MRVVAIVVAAGRGTRLGSSGSKALVNIGDQAMLVHAMRSLMSSGVVDHMVVVAPEGKVGLFTSALVSRKAPMMPFEIVEGGSTRQASVAAGLRVVKDADYVLVHDAARPFVPERMVRRVVLALKAGHPAVAPALPVSDTVKRISGFAVEKMGKMTDSQKTSAGEDPTEGNLSDEDIQRWLRWNPGDPSPFEDGASSSIGKATRPPFEEFQNLFEDAQATLDRAMKALEAFGVGPNSDTAAIVNIDFGAGDPAAGNDGRSRAARLSEAEEFADPTSLRIESVEETLDRSSLRAMQTPQGFTFEAIKRAHDAFADRAASEESAAPDDASLAEAAGIPVILVNGNERAMKITRPFDLRVAELLLADPTLH